MKIYSKAGTKERLFEMMKGVNGEQTVKENYDSPKEKDEKYLNKSVDTDSTDISKYDGDLNYPVEKDLRVNSDMIHQEPVTECDTANPDQEFLYDGGVNEMEGFQQTQYDYDQNGNWIPKGHESKGIGIRPVDQPMGTDNKKELIVKLDQNGGVEKVLDQANDWNQAREVIKKHLNGSSVTASNPSSNPNDVQNGGNPPNNGTPTNGSI